MLPWMNSYYFETRYKFAEIVLIKGIWDLHIQFLLFTVYKLRQELFV